MRWSGFSSETRRPPFHNNRIIEQLFATETERERGQQLTCSLSAGLPLWTARLKHPSHLCSIGLACAVRGPTAPPTTPRTPIAAPQTRWAKALPRELQRGVGGPSSANGVGQRIGASSTRWAFRYWPLRTSAADVDGVALGMGLRTGVRQQRARPPLSTLRTS
jgi:hypothetical protein